MKRIAITAIPLRSPASEVARTLRERGYELTIHDSGTAPNRERLLEMLNGAVGLIAGSEVIDRDVLLAAPTLRVVSRNGVGYDAIDLDAATDLGVVVAYVPDAMVDAVADLTLGLLLSAARKITELDAALKKGEWRRIMAADIGGQTLGLVGTGRIGMAVARRARAFGMRLVGSDPYPNPLFAEELGGSYLPLDELLATADFVSLHSPATPETRGLINRERLARMKPTAFLINAARGSLVDEAALVEALKSGKLAGAALDVFSAEPPVPGSPADELMRLPNVVGTPHVASFTPTTVARMGRAAMENLLEALDGNRLTNIANPGVYERTLRGT